MLIAPTGLAGDAERILYVAVFSDLGHGPSQENRWWIGNGVLDVGCRVAVRLTTHN